MNIDGLNIDDLTTAEYTRAVSGSFTMAELQAMVEKIHREQSAIYVENDAVKDRLDAVLPWGSIPVRVSNAIPPDVAILVSPPKIHRPYEPIEFVALTGLGTPRPSAFVEFL